MPNTKTNESHGNRKVISFGGCIQKQLRLYKKEQNKNVTAI